MPRALKGVTFSFEGIQGMKQALEQATNEVLGKVSSVMEDTAHAVRDTAAATVRANHADQGDLADQIIVKGSKLRWTVGVSDAVISRRGGDRVHQRPFIYGHILEYGSRRQTGSPFMRPAADVHLPRYQSRLDQVI